MKLSHLPLFFAPGLSEGVELTFDGKRNGDRLLDGRLLARGAEIGKVENGVAIFVEPSNWPPAEIQKLRDMNAIPNNWNGQSRSVNWKGQSSPPSAEPAKSFHDALDSVATSGGYILDVASGPGGGVAAAVLSRNPDANIIMNDISAPVLELWREFLAERGIGDNICFAAFDASNMPVRTGTMDAIANMGGFGNIGDKDHDAIREACRVLKPGGRVFSFELVLEPESLQKLPDPMRTRHAAQVSGHGMAPFLEAEGLTVESKHNVGGRELVPEEGGLPTRAARHGVTLRVAYELLIARKPANAGRGT